MPFPPHPIAAYNYHITPPPDTPPFLSLSFPTLIPAMFLPSNHTITFLLILLLNLSLFAPLFAQAPRPFGGDSEFLRPFQPPGRPNSANFPVIPGQQLQNLLPQIFAPNAIPTSIPTPPGTPTTSVTTITSLSDLSSLPPHVQIQLSNLALPGTQIPGPPRRPPPGRPPFSPGRRPLPPGRFPPPPPGSGTISIDDIPPGFFPPSIFTPEPKTCPAPSPSPRAVSLNSCNVQYRTLTGRCTSRYDPTWGEARRVQLSYFDGHSSTFPTGIFLKSAREISNILSHQNTDVFNRHGLNEFFVFFGQFVDHNLVATPLSNDTLDIPVPLGDPYAKPGVLHFRRSVRAFVDADASSMRERPINVLSSPLDLSAVYGVSSERNAALRVLGSGKLKVSPGNMLPYNNDKFVNAPAVTDKFYLAGDHRANEHPVLTCLHTLFMREHNRWCDIIQSAYPSFSSEKVYQTARQINTAQFQKIVYEEFFPSIVGRHLPPYRGHKSSNPTVSDIFSSAAFRVGHTMVGNGISRIDRSGVRTKTLLTEMFFQPGDMVSEDLEDIVRGAVRTSAQEVDLLVHNALRNFLFEKTEGEEGFDLVAMNLQRGRDHALPTYNDIRERFGLRRAEKFSDINSDATVAAKLEKAYEDVVNVEAWPGMVAEEHAAGSGMGETMIRVWSEEFRRLRDGDQFYYREPSFVRELASLRLPGVVDIWRERNMFRSILLRNTDLSEFDLPSGSLFRPRY